jgi:transposase
MTTKNAEFKAAVRYSEAFKRTVVMELERDGKTFDELRRKYGIGHCSLQRWVGKYGNGSRGKVIRVENPEEIDERKRLKQRVRQLEQALATANIDLSLAEAYMKMACERAGIKDVEAFKKKVDGQQSTMP